MVRWKKTRRQLRRNGEHEDFDEESENENSRDEETLILEEEKMDELRDGEHEDNYRDPMIRLAYFPLILSVIFTPCLLLFGFFVENAMFTKIKAFTDLQERKERAGLLDPPMSEILEDRKKYKNEIECLRTCNLHITAATVINTILEIITLAYSFLLLYENRFYVYPLYQIIIYYLIRLGHGYFDHGSRFFNPADIMLSLTTEVLFDLLNMFSVGPFPSPFTRCPLEVLHFPLFLAFLRLLFCEKHDHAYKTERLMRKIIRERFIRNG